MNADPVFERFVERRRRLNERLHASASEVDQWLDQNTEAMPGLSELARLEVLLAERRDMLTELAALDDSFMTHLLELRQRLKEQSDA
jgi:hypothetical protein